LKRKYNSGTIELSDLLSEIRNPTDSRLAFLHFTPTINTVQIYHGSQIDRFFSIVYRGTFRTRKFKGYIVPEKLRDRFKDLPYEIHEHFALKTKDQK
jgi:hypothetical protein